MKALAAFVCGLVFGGGLAVSGMTQPARVLGFLDILGRWDPTLAFVMAGALATSAAGYAVARRRSGPLFDAGFLWPTRQDIDGKLIGGSALFGIGWGLVGLCPGPAVANLATLSPRVLLFVLAMAAGMAVQSWWQSRAAAAPAGGAAALAGSDG